jgi:hypothetical protein
MTTSRTRVFFAFVVLLTAAAGRARAQQLVLLDQFDPPTLGTLVSAGFDATSDRVWVYESFGTELLSFDRAGAFLAAIPRPGEAANDVDIDVAPEALTLNGVPVPAGTVLFVDGETGPAEVYALDPADGTVLASLTTAFGNDHVVGGAWHPTRDTLFLVADYLDATPSTVAEIDPATGAVLNTFGTGAGFTVNYGDLAASGLTGNLLLVSSDHGVIRELMPTGEFVADIALPAGVSSPSGIGLDEGRIEAFLSGTGGAVYHVGLGAPTTTSTTTLPTTTSTSAPTTSTTSTTVASTTTTTTVPAPACELLLGTKLKLAARPKTGERTFGLRSVDRALTLGGGNGSADDPVVHGGVLRLVSAAAGFDDSFALPAANWRYKKKDGQNRGYTLRDAGGIAQIVIKPGKEITIRGGGGPGLEADPAPVDVVLHIGQQCYCWRFGGDVTYKPDKSWTARKAPAPSGCPSAG